MYFIASDTGSTLSQVGQTLQLSISESWTRVAELVPNLIGMLVILIVGYLISKLMQWICVALLKRLRFNKAAEKTGLIEAMGKIGIRRTPAQIVGLLVFWLFMLTFLISATEVLGLENVSQTIDSFVGYLPRVIGAAVVLVVGLLIANFVRTAIGTTLERLGLEYANAASKLAYGLLIVIVGSLAFGQLQIEMTLVNRVIEIILIAAGAALAIALGFGTRNIACHLVAGVYARESFKVGARIKLGDDQGTIEGVTAVNTKVRTSGGETIYIPNSQLMESLVRESGDSA